MKNLRKFFKNQKGFTLIELIVVIAILAILAAIAIPRLAGFTESAKQASDKEAAALVANAGAMYYASNPNMAEADMTTANLLTAGLITNADLAIKSAGYGGPKTGDEEDFGLVLDKSAGTVSVTLTAVGSGATTYTLTK